jgi:hypothetical protein
MFDTILVLAVVVLSGLLIGTAMKNVTRDKHDV